MPNDEDALFSAVDALLERVAQDPLPEPAERKRLREAAGLSQTQIAKVLDARREAVGNWESGKTDPRPPKRAAYARLLEGLAARFPAPPTPAPEAVTGPAVAPPAPKPAPTPAVAAPARPAAGKVTRPATSRRPAVKKATAKPVPALAVVDPRFANGPLGVLDGDGSLYCVAGLVLECPATTIPALVDWTLREAKLGSPRLHRSGKDGDPLIVLTAAAAERLGLPLRLEDRRGLRLPEDHKVIKQITKAKWELTKRGFGPWARVFRRGVERQCVQFAILPWDALDTRSWGDTGQLQAPEIARTLGTYATRVLTPRGSTAVSGLELMTSLRPPTRAVKDEETGTWVSGAMPGSLPGPLLPALPEAPDEHPVVAAEFKGRERGEGDVFHEEAYDWLRDVELLTDLEATRKWAVGIDVNTAFLAAANRLIVGLSEPVRVHNPVFDKTIPGTWRVDLSAIEMDPRLPNPFTFRGERPTGPGWYSTSTVAYAAELIDTYHLPATINPSEAYLRKESGPYLDPWYKHLAEAYKMTMADLGVAAGMGEQEFLDAMAVHQDYDPAMVAVLSAIKSTVKGGIGKLRERNKDTRIPAGEPWPALNRVAWSPHIRAEVIAKARTGMHRKILKTALATQSAPPPAGHLTLDEDALLPIAILSDCAVYLSDGPSPLDVLPHTADSKPIPGGFRLGVSPGMVKHQGTEPLMWAVTMLDEGHNPASHIKGTASIDDGE
ncbi:helix-turn-helix transcriptional regulator [Streptomyces sp. NPDC001876]|uniref:telomere-associated protein Tap n=1 Tax=Streptomyces sp. NPDC001876 TaxID=3154402 RepID=UPI00331A19A9